MIVGAGWGSQTKLATALGLSQAMVSKVVNGLRPCPSDWLPAIAELTGRPTTQIALAAALDSWDLTAPLEQVEAWAESVTTTEPE